MSDQMIENYCKRLRISDDNTIEKSKEILRLVNMKKCTINTVSEAVKMIISIDCATNLCNTEINYDDALTLSGIKKSEYTRQRELIEKLLDLGKKITLDEICARLEISDSIKKDAFRLLNGYKEKNAFLDDINDVQYLAMAVYQSCKIKNYKSNNSTKLIQMSRLNGKMWKRLEEEWNSWIKETKLQNKIQLTSNTSKIEFKKKGSVEYVNENNDDNSIQPYEVWRGNMVKLAKENL
ncbi:origin recognition complex subunit 6 [Contarinia nasturtii]|uniref:origin recognition complex subunit 6 n=1 Tax=Contarinia nasturtii TaxID=265458 RepID=UPI0012D37EE1|nr:origin recognition complex subunit 6 [Contarinia nasturtii]